MNDQNEKPPVFNSWQGWYVFVLFFLLLQILVYYFLTQHFE